VEVSVDELVRVRASGDTGAPKRSPYEPNAAQREQRKRDQAQFQEPRNTDRGTRQNRQYKRDKNGQFNEVDERGGRQRPMTAHEAHVAHVGHVKRVKALQKLLNKLGHNVAVDGKFGPETKKVVNALQRKLGMRETGKVTGSLMKALRIAEILAPCAKGAKRSREMDEVDELIRAVGLVEEDDELDERYEEELEPARSAPLPSFGEILRYDRVWPLEGIEIQRGGDGRTVTAYAAVFDTPTEIKDQYGHYTEDVDRAAFNRELTRSRPQGGRDYWLANCFYNHGADLSGKPNALMSVPLGSPLDIKPDGKGLLTVTRYNKSDLADSVLEAIRNGDIRSQSFRGRIYKSSPSRVPRARGGELPHIRRMELGLTEYGPTPAAFYKDAEIVAVRAEQVAHTLAQLPASERAELVRMLSHGAPFEDSPEAEAVASEVELDAEDSPIIGRSVRDMDDIRRRIAVFKILGGRT
jgi:hypothetical protein